MIGMEVEGLITGQESESVNYDNDNDGLPNRATYLCNTLFKAGSGSSPRAWEKDMSCFQDPDRDHSTLFNRHSIWNAVRYLDIASACTTALSGTSTA
jgi:hypothetical protein